MTALSAASATNAEFATAEHAAPPPLGGIPALRTPRPALRARRDGSRTRSDARLAYRAPLVGGEDGLDDRRFSLSDSPGGVGRVLAENRRAFSALDVTSGLPDDSRDEDQRARARVEAQRKGRVAAAQAALQAHPEAQELVRRDQTKQRLFCARFSITLSDICPMSESVTERCSWCRGRHGVFTPIHVDDVREVLSSPADWLSEVRAREAAVLPGSDYDDG